VVRNSSLPPTPDQAPLSTPVLVFPLSKREQLPALALKEGASASRVPDRLGSTENHLLATLIADKDYAPRRIDHDYPLLRVFVPSREARSHISSAGTR